MNVKPIEIAVVNPNTDEETARVLAELIARRVALCAKANSRKKAAANDGRKSYA